MKKKFFAPTCIIKDSEEKDVMTVSQQIGLDWDSSWGESWDPFA